MRFRDRKDAGQRLAQKLAAKHHGTDGIVYALPRGGVVLGAEIARHLDLPLDLLIARKIGHPHNPEYAIGAVTAGGDMVSNALEVQYIAREWYERRAAAERQEARRRSRVYRGDRPSLPADGKTAIIVDDGIATGLTMEAAIRAIRSQQPARLVIAVPVVPADTAAKLERAVDEVVALDVAADYLGAVGAYYDDFPQVSDEEVIALLRAARAAAH